MDVVLDYVVARIPDALNSSLKLNFYHRVAANLYCLRDGQANDPLLVVYVSFSLCGSSTHTQDARYRLEEV